MTRPARRFPVLRLGKTLCVFLFLASLASACDSTGAPQVVTIKQPFPDQESLAYNLVDTDGAKIGTTAVSIQRQGDGLLLTQDYADFQNHVDNRSVVVDRVTLKPQSARHQIDDGKTQSATDTTYSGDTVSTVAGNGRKHQTKVNAGSYDDGEVFFLMRTIDFNQGYTVQFADVVVANDGTINRAAAVLRVNGTTNISVGGKSFKAWEVQLIAAGATSTAWYEVGPDRRLLRYANSRQTAIELANP